MHCNMSILQAAYPNAVAAAALLSPFRIAARVYHRVIDLIVRGSTQSIASSQQSYTHC
jgi:hypothetical protein